MMVDTQHNDAGKASNATPEPQLSAVKARQGRQGTQTLLVLCISLALAVGAAFALGVIPF
jgi:hypothetical protein